MTDGGGRGNYRRNVRNRQGYRRSNNPSVLPEAVENYSLIGGLAGAAGLGALALTGGLGIIPVVVAVATGYFLGNAAGQSMETAAYLRKMSGADKAEPTSTLQAGEMNSAAASKLVGLDCAQGFNAVATNTMSADVATPQQPLPQTPQTTRKLK